MQLELNIAWLVLLT